MDRITERLLEHMATLKDNIAKTDAVIQDTRQQMRESKERELAMIKRANERKDNHRIEE
jgi:hypothetical protein